MISIFIPSFKKNSFLYSVILLLIPILFLSCSPAVRTVKKGKIIPKSSNTIRVFLDEFSDERELRFKTPVLLKSDNVTQNIAADRIISVNRKEGNVEIKYTGKSFKGNYFSIEPAHPDQRLSYNKKTFRGSINILPKDSGILLINVLPIDDYLKGVIYGEMGVASKPGDFEALKAFTICARNFAYMKIREGRGSFDVYGDIRDQLYSGAGGEKDYINKAVDETKGMVLMYGDTMAKTFYFSSCGGYTEDCGNVFRENDLDYLRSVKDGSEANCSIAPGFKWTEKYSFKEIISFLKAAGLTDEENVTLKDVSVESRFPSGRIKELAVLVASRNGEKEILLKGNNIRYVIKTKKGGLLRSTMCDVEIRGKEVIISGEGNGHGVGFCQWGAIGQSRKGRNFEEILYFYFPNTRIDGQAIVLGSH